MTEENKLSHELRNELKKKLPVQFPLGIKDKFYEVTKIPKGKFSCTLKNDVVKVMKPMEEDNISLDNNPSANSLIYIFNNFQKRRVINEY
jgi:hypothetical protein